MKSELIPSSQALPDNFYSMNSPQNNFKTNDKNKSTSFRLDVNTIAPPVGNKVTPQAQINLKSKKSSDTLVPKNINSLDTKFQTGNNGQKS